MFSFLKAQHIDMAQSFAEFFNGGKAVGSIDLDSAASFSLGAEHAAAAIVGHGQHFVAQIVVLHSVLIRNCKSLAIRST
jgi:hypothetical protein